MLFKRIFGFMAKNLAMDLGTANTLMHIPGQGIVLNEPSVVAIDEQDGKIIAVGSEAKKYLGRTPQGIKVIRPMKAGVIADFDATNQMISHFIRRVMSGLHLVKPKMVIGIPPGITQVEKRAVIESAYQVGVSEVHLVDEAIAAAIGAGLPIEEAIGNIVVDIGGGTTDIAVISLSGIVCGESIKTAGDAMNESIQNFLKDKFQMLIGENMSERIKIAIGTAYPLEGALDMEVSGRSIVTGVPTTVLVTDEHVYKAISPQVQAIVLAIRRVLEKTPPRLIEDSTLTGILLAGGGALLKGIDKIIALETNLPVHVDGDPLTTGVRGAGIIIEDKQRYQSLFIE